MSVTQRVSDQEMERQIKAELLEDNRQTGFEQTLEYIRAYGDLFVLEDEDVSQSVAHLATLKYLVPILEWLFEGQGVGVAEDFRFYQPDIESSKVAPDIAIVDGLVIDTSNSQKSYGVGIDGPPPRIVFEVASEYTWEKDVMLTEKLGKYAQMGVKEYFACDPNPEQVWEGEWLQRGRLLGWRLNPQTNSYTELKKDRQGRFKSEQLDSWLKMAVVANGSNRGYWLRLYDFEGKLRLSEAEAKSCQAQAATRRAISAEARANTAEVRANSAEMRADQSEAALEAEHQRVRELEAMLRQLQPPTES